MPPPAPRAFLRRRLLFGGALLVIACGVIAPPTNVFVLHTPSNEHALHEEGDNLKVAHWEMEASAAGLQKGFYVVKNELEWRRLWPTTDNDKVPLLPPDLDFSREMLLVVAPPDPDATAAEVNEVIDTSERGVHVYLTETTPGVDCEGAHDKPVVDLSRVPRVDGKDVRFHVEGARGDACGSAPEARIACRPNATTTPFEQKLHVAPGTTVACLATDVGSARPILDRTWTFSSLPKGTLTKMTVASGGKGVTFTPDVYGAYKLLFEITDDDQRRGSATTWVDVTPPQEGLVLQMVWTKVDPSDDPATLPRIELHALGVTPPPRRPGTAPQPAGSGVRWGAVKDCSVEAEPPPWCTAKTVGSTTLLTLDPTASKAFAIGVHYTDYRVEGQPIVCVRAYRRGVLRAELCDPAARKDGAWWDAASVDAETGETPDALAREQEAAARAGADGGAPEGGAAEAGATAEAGVGTRAGADAGR